MTDTAETRTRLEEFFRRRSANQGEVRVTRYEPITGGYSRLMARVWVEDDSGSRGYIVRSDPPPGVSILDTDRAAEWAILSSLHRSGKIPMPAPLWFDEKGEELGSPSIVIEMVEGESLVSMSRGRDDSEYPRFGQRLAETAATIPSCGLEHLPPELEVPESWDDYIDARIQYWVDAERANVDRDPFMRLIASYLRAHRPPPIPLSLVHGDFQIANVLVQPDDTYLVVDWELAHVGDPREDLGWCSLASVTQPPDLIAPDEDAFYARYRELTGFTEEQVNPATTDYFLLLASSTVFVSVIEQMARLTKGEEAGMTVTYMSNAVAGMHDVFMRTLKRHAARSGAES